MTTSGIFDIELNDGCKRTHDEDDSSMEEDDEYADVADVIIEKY